MTSAQKLAGEVYLAQKTCARKKLSGHDALYKELVSANL